MRSFEKFAFGAVFVTLLCLASKPARAQNECAAVGISIGIPSLQVTATTRDANNVVHQTFCMDPATGKEYCTPWEATCATGGGTGGSNLNYVVTAYGLKCDGVTDDTAAFNALLTTIGSKVATAIFPGNTKCLLGPVTVPANVNLDFSNGGAIAVNTGTTVTILGGVTNPDNHQIFFNTNSGTLGTVDFTGNVFLTNVFPEWYGAIASGGTAAANTIAVQNAIYGAFGCGPVIVCRTNSNGNYKWNKVLFLQGNYSVNGQINLYHVISFKVQCNGRNHAGLTQTVANTEILDGQSVAYGEFDSCNWASAPGVAQDINHPLISLDYNTSQGTDLAIQFVDFNANNWTGASDLAKVGMQLARSGGGAQGSNVHFNNNAFAQFGEAGLMIGAGSSNTCTTNATNAIEIQVIGGDFQTNTLDGIENCGGGQLQINGTTFENGFGTSQTGYDIFCSALPGGEACSIRDSRSESLFMFGGSTIFYVEDSFKLDLAGIPVPGATATVGQIIQGSKAGGHGAYHAVTAASSAYSGLGQVGSTRTASGGSATTLIDSVGGLTVNAWIGWSVSILGGTGANAYCIVTSNTATTFTCTGGWLTDFNGVATNFTPDGTTAYIVEPNWGSQTTSGGVTWSNNLSREEFTASSSTCHIDGGFFPGVQIACSANSDFRNMQVTRADWYAPGGAFVLDDNNVNLHFDGVMVGAPNGALGAGVGWLGSTPLQRAYRFSRNGITGLANFGVDQKGSIPIAWAMGVHQGGVAQVDAQIGPNPETATKNGSIDFVNNSTGAAFHWKMKANGDFAFTTGAGQHLENFAANSDLAGTVGVAASTTASVTFTTAYTSTPVCTLTPQTTGLTSWYISAISSTGFTVTVAPSGTYTIAYQCIGNPN